MIHITCHHFAHQFLSHSGFMRPMPSAEFVFHIEAKRIAGIEKFRVSRIMAKPDSIHIHALDKLHIFNIFLFAKGASAFRTETVTVYPFKDDFATVDINSVVLTYLNRTEAEFLTMGMESLALLVEQGELCGIKSRCLSCP